MAIQNLRSQKYHGKLKSGKVNDAGTIGVYVAGTSFGTLATIWDTQTKDAALTNPATLGSDGTLEIWFDVTVDIQEKDSSGAIVDQSLAINPNVVSTSTGNYNQVINGSFEIGTTAPDNWTLSTETGGTIALDASSGGQSHGDQGLKFTGTTNGAGTATSDFFPVLTSSKAQVKFTYKSSIADTTNAVKIYWYQYDDTASSTASDTLYSETSANPSSFTTYVRQATVPSDAVKAKIELTGVGSSGTTKVGPTWFDDIQYIPDVSSGKQTLFIPAVAMQPTASNGSAFLATVETTAGRPDMQVLDFDATSDEHAQFQIAFPKLWDEGTVTFQAFWTSTATDTDGVAWGLQGVSVSNDGTIDVAYGTAVVVTDDNISAAEDLLVTSESAAITIAGTPAADDMCFFRVFRDVSDANDDMTEDARLIGIKLFYTTVAWNDD